jgi:8-oxo-dGTP diphosphatase
MLRAGSGFCFFTACGNRGTRERGREGIVLMPDVPTFGRPPAEGGYVDRLAVYAVIRGEDGRVAVVHSDGFGLFLPGGGVEAGEGLEEAIRREVREECACELQLCRRVGEAVQYHGAYRARHVFFVAELVGPPTGTGEHELLWLDPAEAAARFYHRSHAWAIGQLDRPGR